MNRCDRCNFFINPTLPQSLTASLAETLSVVDVVLASVGRYLPPHVPRDDLASAGKVALVEALLGFEGPLVEARAYCYLRVRGAVMDELRRLDPLSRHTRAQVTLMRRATAALERQLGRVPTPSEVAVATGFSAESLALLERLAKAAAPCSVNETDCEGELLHVPLDADAACPAHAAETDDTKSSVQAALDRLAPNYAHVLRRYYFDDATLDDVAVELGVSKERVRQIREAAEKKLREDLVILALWQ
jgi:RNA polymerase sigma factor for flagellar operon FliA